MSYSIQLFKTAAVDVPSPEVYWMCRFGDWTRLQFLMAVIRGGGKTIVLNTGFPADIAGLAKAWKDFLGERAVLERPDEWRPEIALPAAGIDPASVDYVLLSPIQLYATGNVQLFPNAKFCVSRKGWIEDIMAPTYHHHVPRAGCISDADLFWLLDSAADRLLLMDDVHELLPGLVCRWIGTHHRSSFTTEVESSKGRVILSDCAFHYANIEENIPLGIAESIIECDAAYQHIRKTADVFIPLYEPLVWDRHPGGTVA